MGKGLLVLDASDYEFTQDLHTKAPRRSCFHPVQFCSSILSDPVVFGSRGTGRPRQAASCSPRAQVVSICALTCFVFYSCCFIQRLLLADDCSSQREELYLAGNQAVNPTFVREGVRRCSRILSWAASRSQESKLAGKLQRNFERIIEDLKASCRRWCDRREFSTLVDPSRSPFDMSTTVCGSTIQLVGLVDCTLRSSHSPLDASYRPRDALTCELPPYFQSRPSF